MRINPASISWRYELAYAITTVESYFRPRPWRLLEYGTWWFLSFYWPERAARMTLGASQVRPDIIGRYLTYIGKTMTLLNIIYVGENFNHAVRLAATYLEVHGCGDTVSRTYTERFNPFYEHLLAMALHCSPKKALYLTASRVAPTFGKR